jgi:hypothetical protein
MTAYDEKSAISDRLDDFIPTKHIKKMTTHTMALAEILSNQHKISGISLRFMVILVQSQFGNA